MTRRALVALAILAAVVGLVGTLLPRARAPATEGVGGDGPRGTAAPLPVERPRGPEGLRGRDPAAREGAAREDAPAKARDLSGRVVDPDGKPVAGCRVAVPWSAGAVFAETDADGRFTLRLPTSKEPPTAVVIRYEAMGFGTVSNELPWDGVGPVGTVRLGDGEDVAGRVVDPDGRGVADFTVVFEHGFGGFRSLLWDRTSSHLVTYADPRDANSPLVGWAVTDRDGAFRLRGVTGDPGRATGTGDGWMLEGAQEVERGAENVLRAVPAAVTGIRLRAPVGVPLPASWDLRVAAAGHGGEGLTASGDAVAVWWSRAKGFAKELSAEVAVHVDGFEPAHEAVVVPAEERRRDVEFRLRPLAASESATVVVTVVTDDPVFAKRPFDLETYDPDERDVQVSRVPAETLPDGRVRARATPGRWWLRLRPADGWCNPVYWEGEQLLENPVTWTVPPHGGARITVTADFLAAIPSHEVDLSVYPPDGGIGSGYGTVHVGDGPLEVQALTLGDWEVRLFHRIEGGIEDRTLTFTVRAHEGVDVRVDVPKAQAKSLR